MTVDSYLKRLERYGITADKIPQLSDSDILRCRGMGSKGLALLRKKYGTASNPGSLELARQVENALAPVLTRRSGVGMKTVRVLSRMVAAYFA